MIRSSDSFRDYVLGGSEIRNPVLWEIRKSESSPVLFGRSEILNRLSFSMGEPLKTRNSENHLVSYAWLKH